MNNILTLTEFYGAIQQWEELYLKKPSKIKLSRHHVNELTMGLPLYTKPYIGDTSGKTYFFGIEIEIDESNMTMVEFIP